MPQEGAPEAGAICSGAIIGCKPQAEPGWVLIHFIEAS
jgi:hypothetical protein